MLIDEQASSFDHRCKYNKEFLKQHRSAGMLYHQLNNNLRIFNYYQRLFQHLE